MEYHSVGQGNTEVQTIVSFLYRDRLNSAFTLANTPSPALPVFCASSTGLAVAVYKPCICVCAMAMLHKSKASSEIMRTTNVIDHSFIMYCMVQDGRLEIDGTKMTSGSV